MHRELNVLAVRKPVCCPPCSGLNDQPLRSQFQQQNQPAELKVQGSQSPRAQGTYSWTFLALRIWMILSVQCLHKIFCASANMWLVHLVGRIQKPRDEVSSRGSRLCGSMRWVSAVEQAWPRWLLTAPTGRLISSLGFPTILSGPRTCCDIKGCGILRCHLSTNSAPLWKWDQFPLDSRSFKARAGLTILTFPVLEPSKAPGEWPDWTNGAWRTFQQSYNFQHQAHPL